MKYCAYKIFKKHNCIHVSKTMITIVLSDSTIPTITITIDSYKIVTIVIVVFYVSPCCQNVNNNFLLTIYSRKTKM